MMLKDKRVFISGGNGVIGNCLTKKLDEQGAVVFVGDLKPRPIEWPPHISYRQGDLNYITKEELEDFEPDYFFHLAATFERSTETYLFWDENYRHNVRLSNHLMTCLKDCSSLEKVIFASSYLIYDPELYLFDKPAKSPYSLKETDPIYPRNLTGVAKLLHEIELRFLNGFKKDQYKIVSARIFRGYGLNSKDIISRWVRSLINGEELVVYRKEGMFDYIFAEDTAEGLIQLALSKESEGVVNLGTGKARRVTDVLGILKNHFPSLRFEEREGDVDIKYEASQADVGLLSRLAAWEPKFTLESSIAKIVAFERARQKTNTSPTVKREPYNVLVTSISKKVPMLKSVASALSKSGINGKLHGGDTDITCIGRHFVDSFWNMPALNENSFSDIFNYCTQNDIRIIIPSRDGELSFWSSHKTMFKERGISVMVSDENAIQSTIDKFQFYKKGFDLGYPVIKTALDIFELQTDRYVVKERFGAGAKSLGLDLSITQAQDHAHKLSEPIFQSFITGLEYSIDIYITLKGEVKGTICRSRDKVVNGESQITVTHSLPQIETLCSNFAKELNLVGHLVFQVLQDDSGSFHIIECNSRFGGASTLSIEAGLDSFYWFLLESLGENLSNYKFAKKKSVLRQVRYASDYVSYLPDHL